MFEGKGLSDFVTNKIKTFFKLFMIYDEQEYNSLRSSINTLKVGNNITERGIALINKFND